MPLGVMPVAVKFLQRIMGMVEFTKTGVRRLPRLSLQLESRIYGIPQDTKMNLKTNLGRYTSSHFYLMDPRLKL